MSTTIVNIVSDQTIPNVVFIKEMPTANRYLFLTTQRMEEKGITDNIIRVCQIPLHLTTKIPVLENSFLNIQNRLKELNLNAADEEYVVNITGGTKPMSIVVHDFFKHLRSQIYYMPLGSNGFIKCNDPTDETLQAASCSLTLFEYLSAHGIEIANPNEINQLLVNPHFTARIFSEKLLHAPEIYALIQYISEFTKLHKHEPGSISLAAPPTPLIALPNFLYFTLQFPLADKQHLNRREINYLTGGWFKEYLYTQIKTKHTLTDLNIGLCARLVRKGIAIEPDIIYTRNNALTIGLGITTPRKTELENTIYRLSGIKKGRDFGLQSKGFIAIAQNYRDKFGNIKYSLSQRAQLQDITIYDELDMHNL